MTDHAERDDDERPRALDAALQRRLQDVLEQLPDRALAALLDTFNGLHAEAAERHEREHRAIAVVGDVVARLHRRRTLGA